MGVVDSGRRKVLIVDLVYDYDVISFARFVLSGCIFLKIIFLIFIFIFLAGFLIRSHRYKIARFYFLHVDRHTVLLI